MGRVLDLGLSIVNAARDGFIAWDKRYQHGLVQSAKSRDEARLALERYRKRREKVIAYFLRVYALIGIAADQDPVAQLAGVPRLPDGTDRFELGNRVGGGSEGEVWEASDRKLNRTVAMKFLHEDVVFEARLLVHGRILARVSHPNVVSVFDVVTVRHPRTKRPAEALAMEYLAETLAQRLRRQIPSDQARWLGRGLLDGLEALHMKDIFHRDLRAPNVLISPDGVLKLIDPRLSGQSAPTTTQAADADRLSDLVAARDLLVMILQSSDYDLSVAGRLADALPDQVRSLVELRTAFEAATTLGPSPDHM